MVAGLSLVPGCYNVPEPVCGFFCGSNGACPADYTCMADNRCHLDGASATLCFTIDAGRIDAPDAPRDTPSESVNPPPTVVSTIPGANATGVPITTTVAATFSEPVTNVTGSTFALNQNGTPITGSVTYNPGTTSATFTPSAPLTSNTIYTAQLGPAIVDAQGAPLVPTTWTFTTAADTAPPMLVSTTPAPNASGVSVTAPIQALFTEPVVNATITTFTLMNGATAIPGTVTTSSVNRSATFTASAALPPNTLLTAMLTAGITDAAGNPLASAPMTWTFTTSPDTIAPTVVTTSPAASATGVAVSSTVGATFSEAVTNATTTTFTLKDGTATIPGTVTTSAVNKTATFAPTAALPANTLLTASLTAGITDVAGNPLASAPVTWTFTTAADTTPPTLTMTSPASNATGVLLTAAVVATFSEPVTATTATFTLMNGATAIPGTVTTSSVNKTATFTPTGALPPSTLVTATLSVTDLAGNAVVGSPISWTFTTVSDTTAPMLVNTSPMTNATGVAQNATVVATFDEPVNASMSTFTVMNGASAIAGTVTTSSVNKTATFTPMLPLPTNTVLTATLTAGVTDLAGNPLSGAPVIWSFTTVPDTVAPVVQGTNPANGAALVPTSTPIAVTFDEPVTNVNGSSFTVKTPAPSTPVLGTFASSMGGRVWTFMPSAGLPAATVITVTLSTAITDTSANPLAAPVTFTFTTQ